MSELNLDGRLGVETINPVQGCCVDTILEWRPRLTGQKNKCLFCENPMKTIQAGEAVQPQWTGMLNETHIEREAQSFGVASIWFSKKKFSNQSAVKSWCMDKGIGANRIEEDYMSYAVLVGKVVPDTERVLWADKGVVSVFGIEKMESSDMASGGALHPYQAADAKKDEKEEEEEESESTQEKKTCMDKEATMATFNKSLDALFSK